MGMSNRSLFFSGQELSQFLVEHNIHLFFVEGVDGTGKTSLLNDMGVEYTHFPTEQCVKIEDPTPFDYARDIVSTVKKQIEKAARLVETGFNCPGVNLYFDRGFMSTLAYSPTIIRDYVQDHDPRNYYHYNSWDYGADDMLLNALGLMMEQYVKHPEDRWFVRVWQQFVSGMLQCPFVHIIYLPSYNAHGLVERIQQRGLQEDIRLIESIGVNVFQKQLEERLEAYDFIRLLFSTLPMVLKRRDICSLSDKEGSRLFFTADELKKFVDYKNSQN